MLWHYFELNISMADHPKLSPGDNDRPATNDQVKETALKEKSSGKQNDVNDDSLVIKNNPDYKDDH
jgi:hypothetical protein